MRVVCFGRTSCAAATVATRFATQKHDNVACLRFFSIYHFTSCAAYYETRSDAKSSRAPGLESLDPSKLSSSAQTAPQKPAQQVSVPGPLLKSGVPAARTAAKPAAKPAVKPAAKPAAKAAVKAAPKSEAEKAGIPASPTALPKK